MDTRIDGNWVPDAAAEDGTAVNSTAELSKKGGRYGGITCILRNRITIDGVELDNCNECSITKNDNILCAEFSVGL